VSPSAATAAAVGAGPVAFATSAGPYEPLLLRVDATGDAELAAREGAESLPQPLRLCLNDLDFSAPPRVPWTDVNCATTVSAIAVACATTDPIAISDSRLVRLVPVAHARSPSTAPTPAPSPFDKMRIGDQVPAQLTEDTLAAVGASGGQLLVSIPAAQPLPVAVSATPSAAPPSYLSPPPPLPDDAELAEMKEIFSAELEGPT
jgi:hypothetical protein